MRSKMLREHKSCETLPISQASQLSDASTILLMTVGLCTIEPIISFYEYSGGINRHSTHYWAQNILYCT